MKIGKNEDFQTLSEGIVGLNPRRYTIAKRGSSKTSWTIGEKFPKKQQPITSSKILRVNLNSILP